jgi:hypothetical protein
LGIYIDERADEPQREALQKIFGGEAGGWSGEFANVVGEVRGIEYVPITFAIADDLAYWAAEVPGKATARAEALTGPTTPEGKRVRVHNPPLQFSVMCPFGVHAIARSLPQSAAGIIEHLAAT